MHLVDGLLESHEIIGDKLEVAIEGIHSDVAALGVLEEFLLWSFLRNFFLQFVHIQILAQLGNSLIPSFKPLEHLLLELVQHGPTNSFRLLFERVVVGDQGDDILRCCFFDLQGIDLQLHFILIACEPTAELLDPVLQIWHYLLQQIRQHCCILLTLGPLLTQRWTPFA